MVAPDRSKAVACSPIIEMTDIAHCLGLCRNKKEKASEIAFRSFFGRGDKIRTCDLYVPNVALYQTEPHLELIVGETQKRSENRTYASLDFYYYITEITFCQGFDLVLFLNYF